MLTSCVCVANEQKETVVIDVVLILLKLILYVVQNIFGVFYLVNDDIKSIVPCTCDV